MSASAASLTTATTARTTPLLSLRAASLVAAPLAALVARSFWTPYDDEEPAAYIAEVARHTDRSDVGTLLMILSALLLVPAAFALTSVLRPHRPRLARVTAAMIVTGAVGMACMSTAGLFASTLARGGDLAAATAAWDRFFADPNGELVFLGIVVGVLGFFALGVGLYRSRLVARGAAVLTGLGGATMLFTTGGPVRPLLLAAAAMALAGFAWVGASAGAGADGDPSPSASV